MEDLRKYFDQVVGKDSQLQEARKAIEDDIEQRVIPYRTELAKLRSIYRELRVRFSVTPVSLSVTRKVAGGELKITINSDASTIHFNDRLLGGGWGDSSASLKWMALHIYEISRELELCLVEIKEKILELIEKYEEVVDESYTALTPELVLKRMKGGETG